MNQREALLEPFQGRLASLFGRETPVGELSSTLKAAIQLWRMDTVGAMLITCSDEIEHECADAFNKHFCAATLPRLKIGAAPPYRVANLGGRYEWMSLSIAESHFVTRDTIDKTKLMLVKINSHVAIQEKKGRGESASFGKLNRHGIESDCSGVLADAIRGSNVPAISELTDSWSYDGKDRLEAIRQMPEDQQLLYAALLSARMQARSCVLEAQDIKPTSPTLFLILPCVTINRPGRDGEMPVGAYLVDRRPAKKGGTDVQVYRGLSDWPSNYNLGTKHGRLVMTDDSLAQIRDARNHRELIQAEAEAKKQVTFKPNAQSDEALKKLQQMGSDQNLKRKMLKSLLTTMVEASPIGTAAVLFGSGAMGIWNTYKAHKMLKDASQTQEAVELVQEVQRRVDQMHPEQAAALLNSLADAYKGKA